MQERRALGLSYQADGFEYFRKQTNKQKNIQKTQYAFLRSVKKSFVKCPQPFSHYGQPLCTQVRSHSVLPHSCSRAKLQVANEIG